MTGNAAQSYKNVSRETFLSGHGAKALMAPYRPRLEIIAAGFSGHYRTWLSGKPPHANRRSYEKSGGRERRRAAADKTKSLLPALEISWQRGKLFGAINANTLSGSVNFRAPCSGDGFAEIGAAIALLTNLIAGTLGGFLIPQLLHRFR